MQFIFEICIILYFSVFKKPSSKTQAQAVKNNEDSDQYFIGGLRSYNHVKVIIFICFLLQSIYCNNLILLLIRLMKFQKLQNQCLLI